MSELTKAHIETLVSHFYAKVQKDEILSPIFNEVAQVDWDHHIPKICQFWNSIMLKTNEYHGNAYMKHVNLGKLVEMQETHFTRWLNLFQQEAIQHLPADKAEEIIHKARAIAQSLSYGVLKRRS
jgi:hemoglobin